MARDARMNAGKLSWRYSANIRLNIAAGKVPSSPPRGAGWQRGSTPANDEGTVPSGGATRRGLYNQSCHMHRTIKEFCQAARASPGGDARHCPHGANSELGLPAPGRGRPKKRVQEIRLATINIGTLTSRSRELCDRLKERHVDIACVQETKWKGR